MQALISNAKALAKRWALPLGVLVVLLAISIVLMLSVRSGSFYPTVVWPERLSASTQGQLVVTVHATEDHQTIMLPGTKVTLLEFPSDKRYYSIRRQAELLADGASMREVSVATTDAQGRAVLSLPAVRPSGTPNTLWEPKDGQVRLALKLENERGVKVLVRDYNAPPKVRLIMSTDRPLYQPGQTIHMRALGVDPDSGKPVKGPVRWVVRDPRGNQVLREDGALSDGGGIASMSLPLDSRCIQGTWSLTVEHAGITASAKVEVRPFRLPRFKTTVTLDKPKVVPGAVLAGQINALYTYGDPVAQAQVDGRVVYTNNTGRTESAQFEGQTDDQGTMRFDWQVPGGIRPGSRLDVQAIVTTEAGRAERGKTSASVAGTKASLELLAAGASGWRPNILNPGFAIVTGPDGRPMANAQVSLTLPESKTERSITTTTDASGAARFEWIPPTNVRPLKIRAEVSPPEGRPFKRDITVRLSYKDELILTAPTVLARVGEPFELSLSPHTTGLTAVAFNRGYPVASAPVSQRGNLVSITPGPEARGLTEVVLIDSSGRARGRLPIWVSQRGGDTVEVKTDAPQYTPGQAASVALAFDPGQGQDKPEVPVRFGLVAVDEALYALKERASVPLTVLLREEPARVAQVNSALGRLDFEARGLAAEVEAVRFAQRFGQSSYNQYSASDVSRYYMREIRRPLLEGWLIVLSLLLLGCGFVASRSAWRAWSKQALSWRRTGAMVGVSLMAMVAAGFLGAISEETLLGGVLVWSGVVLCWLVAAVVVKGRQHLALWMEMILLMGLLTPLALMMLDVLGSISGPVEVVLAVAWGLPAALLAVQMVGWAFVLHAAELRKPGFGLMTFGGVLLGGFVLSLGLLGTVRYEGGMMQKSAAPMSADSAVMEEERDADGESFGDDGPPKASKPDAGAAKGGPRVREFFPETMVWAPEVLSDADGKAKVDLQIPDSITTWRLEATATAWDGRFGDARLGVKVWQPFFVELELPTDLTVGDTAQIPVSLINNHADGLKTALEATGEGALEVVQSPESVDVEAGGRALVTLVVRAVRPGAGSVTIKAVPEGGKAGDAVRRVARVRPDGRQLAQTQSGIIRQGWRGQVEAPQAAIKESTSASAAVFPSAVSDAFDGLDAMLRGPTGCFEQTSSATFPNVMILRALRQVDPEAWPGGAKAHRKALLKANKLMSLGHQRMLRFMHGSGGFMLYPPKDGVDRKPEVMLTAYGVMQLAQMATVHPVDEQVVARAVRWLVSRQNANGTWPVYANRVSGGSGKRDGDPAQLRSTAFVTLALLDSPERARQQKAIDKALDYLATKLDQSGAPDTLAMAVAAFDKAGREQDAKRIAQRLASLVRREGDVAWWSPSGATWMGGVGRYGDTEATALAAWALLSVEAHAELLTPAMRFLAQRRSPWGGWGTTQATVWSLRALEKLRSIDSGGPVTVSMWLDAQPWEGVGGEGSQWVTKPGDALVRRFEADPLSGPGQIEVKASRRTAAMAQATVRYAVPWSSELAKVEGERLEVVLDARSEQVARGEALEVTVKVSNPGRDGYGATIVELPLAPGAFVDADQFEAWQQAGQIDAFEVLPTHVRLYVPSFRALGQRTWTYQMRPLVRGQYALPPARAYIFYAPEPMTEVAGGRVEVR